MTIDIKTAVAFTGHRPDKIGGYDEKNPIATRVKKALEEEIIKASDDGFLTFISGGAIGTDLYAAEIVLELKKYLVIAQPFPSQYIRWPGSIQTKYCEILSKAHEVISVSEDPYSVIKLLARNIWMVDHSSRLIAVYDGSGKGGTAHCIKYAQSQNKEIRVIKP